MDLVIEIIDVIGVEILDLLDENLLIEELAVEESLVDLNTFIQFFY